MKSRLLWWRSKFLLNSLLASITFVICITAAANVHAQATHYTITDLGALPGGPFSQATFVNNRGLVSGLSVAADGTQRAVIWYHRDIADISTPGLGGPNSGAFGVNERGQVDGQAENSTLDPNNENFCDYFTGLECRPFIWQNGAMYALPLLGGNNGTVANINNRGQVAGVAENGVVDPQCPTSMAVNGTGPQVLDFKPVIWGPNKSHVRELRLLPGDSVGMALWVNDEGEAVGMSGSCANTVLPPFAIGPHAVLWKKDGSVHDLGNLGGTANLSVLGASNVAFAINNRSQVTGVSVLPDGVNFHAFLWSSSTGMQDLGTLPGDNLSAGLGMNNLGDVAGASIAGPDPLSGAPKAVIWHNGIITDLNTVVPADTSLFLLTAFMISDAGQVAGFGLDLNTFEVHGFLATPMPANIAAAARGQVTLQRAPSDALGLRQHGRTF